MTADDLPALRQALEAGELKHEEILELLEMAEQQAAEIESLERRADLGQTWARAHYKGKEKAEKALLHSVRRVARDSAKLARRWPKHELAKTIPGGKKPTKEQVHLARAVANGIATHIENQVKGE